LKNLAHRNLRLVSFATNSNQNVPTKIASKKREAQITTRLRLNKEVSSGQPLNKPQRRRGRRDRAEMDDRSVWLCTKVTQPAKQA